MAQGAPKGNQFWKARVTHGRKRIFENPASLWRAACEYFQWCDDNPLYESKLVSFQGESVIEEVPKRRVKTIIGLCLFLRTERVRLMELRSKKGFRNVLRAIDEVIYNDKFEGASSGFFNARFIARDLGLHEKVYNVNEEVTKYKNPEEELKKRGIPMPEIEIEDLEHNKNSDDNSNFNIETDFGYDDED